MRLNDEELELVSIARGQNIDEMVAVVEHIVAARVAEALATIEALVNNGQTVGWIERDGETAWIAADAVRAAIASHYEGISR